MLTIGTVPGRIVPLLVLAASLVPAPASAGVRTIWPEQLVPATWSRDACVQSPEFVGATTPEAVYFHAAVQLPVGALVTKVEYVHNALGGPCLTRVTLFRKGYDETGPETLAAASMADLAGAHVVSGSVAEEDRPVPANHHHWVEAYIQGDMGRIQAIRVYYRR